MGIQNGQYENFTMLRKRVKDIAVEEINRKTDIVMSYDLEKFGRLTTAIIFTMHPKENSRKDDTLIDNVKSKLKFYGVAESMIEELVQRHDLEYLSANLNIVEDQIKK